MIADDVNGESTPSMLEFLEAFLSNKSEVWVALTDISAHSNSFRCQMVIYEAARAIVGLPQATSRELSRAVSGTPMPFILLSPC